jgi:tetratricopeptide (TPR) repeat protein
LNTKKVLGIVLVAIIIGGVFIFLGPIGNSEKKAKKLFYEANNYAVIANDESRNYSTRAEFHDKAGKIIYQILYKYPDSETSKLISSGMARLDNLNFDQFKDLGISLNLFAQAENNPLYCAALVADHFVVVNYLHASIWDARVYFALGQRFIDEGDCDLAKKFLIKTLKVGSMVDDGIDRDVIFKEVIREFGRAGMLPEAFETFNSGRSQRLKENDARSLIAKGLVESKQFEKAIEMARSINNPELKGYSFLDICYGLIASEQKQKGFSILDEAKSTAEEIVEDSNKAVFLSSISRFFRDQEKIKEGLEILSRAESILRESRNIKYRDWVTYRIVIELSLFGKHEDALKYLEQLKGISYYYDECAKSISINMGKNGDFSKAFKTVELIKDKREKERAMEQIIVAKAESGNIAEALEECKRLNGLNREEVKKSIVCLMAKNGHFEDAEEITRSLKPGRVKFLAQWDLVIGLINNGKYTEAQRIEKEIVGIYDSEDGIQFFSSLASEFGEAGKKMIASEYFLKALEKVKTADPKTQVLGLAWINDAYKKIQQNPSENERVILKEFVNRCASKK